jgi:hypothetical protein
VAGLIKLTIQGPPLRRDLREDFLTVMEHHGHRMGKLLWRDPVTGDPFYEDQAAAEKHFVLFDLANEWLSEEPLWWYAEDELDVTE